MNRDKSARKQSKTTSRNSRTSRIMEAEGHFRASDVEKLFNDLSKANSEQAKKERFHQYLTIAFSGDEAAQTFISSLALGAERTISNITRGGKVARGRADSQTDTIIIEWEKDLGKTGDHAKEQLAEYLEGNWKSGQPYHFVLLATDGIRWRRYAPDWSKVELGEFELGRNFDLREVRRFDLSKDTFSEFPFFLDEVLFESRPRSATFQNVQSDFGDTSRVFINSIRILKDCADEDIAKRSELKVAIQQWKRFLSVAYGAFDDSPTMFLVHTYLSAFAKFIAYAVVTKSPTVDEAAIKGIITGTIFKKLNIERFVEDDFFHWVGVDRYFKVLRPMFREINQRLANYDFSVVREDILKGVYQELIDLETRHALGEYYTPDWLCERIVSDVHTEKASTFLDPACGSGSFLRAIISKLRQEFPDISASTLAAQVVGIDIHPLSVLISKTTVLLALGDSVKQAKEPVTLHVYLANSLLVPRGTADLFDEAFQISVDNKDYIVNLKGLRGADDFDRLITFCDDVVRRYSAPDPIKRSEFIKLFETNDSGRYAADLPDQLYDIYKGMKIAHAEGRDSIWKFILQNSYKPVFYREKFDFVIGNPPWLTYADVSNREYQDVLKRLSDSYGATPPNKANMPHLEIAAIFLAHSLNYFAKRNGQLIFVLPRSFMSADQHENTRSGEIKSVKLTEIWDLDGVSPLFQVPSCVVFANRTTDGPSQRRISEAGIAGRIGNGRLPRAQIHWADATKAITLEKCRWYLSRLQASRKGVRSAITLKPTSSMVGSNAYADRFTQGATIVPRNFYVIELNQEIPGDQPLQDRVVAIRTAAYSDQEAKKPWKGQLLEGRSEGKFLFRTAFSRNVVPFALVDPLLVVLPVLGGAGKAPFKVATSKDLFASGARYASEWFHDAEKRWDSKLTQRSKAAGMTLQRRLDFQRGISGQNPNARYLVIYTSSSKDASATVVDRNSSDLPFIVDHTTYWCECVTLDEAHFLAAYINSGYANEVIKDFQARGLFGARHVHKLIVKIPFPRFSTSSTSHRDLSQLGRDCADRAAAFLAAVDTRDLNTHALGRVRLNLRKNLSASFREIDRLVESISAEASATAVQSKVGRAARSRKAVPLFD